MRLFVALKLAEHVKNELKQQLPIIRNSLQLGKWVPEENWHITLLFLGEVDEKEMESLDQALNEAVKNVVPFQLQLKNISAFPSENKPNILWAGVHGDLQMLNKLYQNFVEALTKTKITFDAKPKYTPHVTLARKVNVPFKKENFKLTSSVWQVTSLTLYQSVFTVSGVKYQPILTKEFLNEREK
ncbi:RNA 2',3'-cyclic phosphodiesterase [Tepidibacillus decaturensis]|uniref:RNA 2',3'-cyclic phosphodiesterase n=1 Tax=Tepidibacillus decaturensis TaxID=1413211 RepID=A0A135L4E3_9BACI|nr:RNA 2',3'-cyclic phosphodiesterase [Tepidibacillus decaturensis]KXG43821.1 hypothetical protein U473_07220 [Tepidibacillus decaturensis]